MRRRESSMVSLAIILGAGLCAAPASGQWTLTVLHPSGASLSNAVSASGGQQAGWLDHRAGFWSGSADSWTDLHPAGASWSTATSAYGTQQAGYAAFGVPSLPRAGFWTDTASSWIDLHPAGANHSYAWGTSGTQQVGEVYINGSARAALWSGSAASFVDLTPAGSSAAAFAASGSAGRCNQRRCCTVVGHRGFVHQSAPGFGQLLCCLGHGRQPASGYRILRCPRSSSARGALVGLAGVICEPAPF